MTLPVRLVVSPHLDDAVFSCPTWIHDACRQGAEVHVLTVFSSASPSASEADQRLYARRRREDQRALETLGAAPVHGGLPDAPFRSSRYRSFEGIVCDPPDPLDPAPEAVSELLAAVVARLKPAAIHAMLAVGTHVDHRIVFDAVRRLERTEGAIEFTYAEDRPYSLVPGAVAVRLAQLGHAHPQATAPPSAEDYFAGLIRAPYVRAHLGQDSRGRVASHAHRQWRATRAEGMASPARVRSLAWSPADATLFLDAMQAYESQFEDFFGSVEQACAWLGVNQPMHSHGVEMAWQLSRSDA